MNWAWPNFAVSAALTVDGLDWTSRGPFQPQLFYGLASFYLCKSFHKARYKSQIKWITTKISSYSEHAHGPIILTSTEAEAAPGEPAAAKRKRLEVQQAAHWLRFQNSVLTLPSHKDFHSSTEEAEVLIWLWDSFMFSGISMIAWLLKPFRQYRDMEHELLIHILVLVPWG